MTLKFSTTATRDIVCWFCKEPITANEAHECITEMTKEQALLALNNSQDVSDVKMTGTLEVLAPSLLIVAEAE